MFGKNDGLPPTATSIYLAETVCFYPLLSVSSTVFLSVIAAKLLKYLTSFLDNSVL